MANNYLKKMVKINIGLCCVLATLVTGCTIGHKTAEITVDTVYHGNVPIRAINGHYNISLICISSVDVQNGVVYAYDANGRTYTYYTDDFDIYENEWYTCLYDIDTLDIVKLCYERPDMLYDRMD